MELIVAVYDDWGIGCCGTQPVALSADRKFSGSRPRVPASSWAARPLVTSPVESLFPTG